MSDNYRNKLALTGNGRPEHRREHDFYPTPPDVTHALMRFLGEICVRRVVWEPACGDGSMAKVIASYGNHVIASDIRKDCGYGDGGIDYLGTTMPHRVNAVITNPPFNLSVPFILKALGDATNLVAMLLKSQYWHSRNRYDLFMNHRPQFICPLTWRPNFAHEKGNKPTMEVAWTVWVKNYDKWRPDITNYVPLLRPDNIGEDNTPTDNQLLLDE